MAVTTYGDISPRTAAFVAVELLKRALPYLVFEKFGQAKTLPARKSNVMKFRRYNALSMALTALTEGVTPPSKKLTYTDVTATLYQYGDLVEITDIVMDTHEDPVLKEAQTIMGEQAAKTVETLRYNVLKAGTSVYYSGNVAGRTSVTAVASRADQRAIIRALDRQDTGHITSIVRSTPNFNTEAVLPSYVAIGHVDLKTDIRSLTGFIDVKDYGSISPWEGEVGGCEDARYICTTICTAFADGGSATGAATTRISTAGSGCDVYPILYIGKDSYGLIALKGEFAVTPMVINPTPSKSDPLGQRGSISWKTMQTAVILNDAWMYRYEVAATL